MKRIHHPSMPELPLVARNDNFKIIPRHRDDLNVAGIFFGAAGKQMCSRLFYGFSGASNCDIAIIASSLAIPKVSAWSPEDPTPQHPDLMRVGNGSLELVYSYRALSITVDLSVNVVGIREGLDRIRNHRIIASIASPFLYHHPSSPTFE